jgi:hypothetical protein
MHDTLQPISDITSKLIIDQKDKKLFEHSVHQKLERIEKSL